MDEVRAFAKLILFLAFVITVPCFYYLFVVGGFLPVSFMIFMGTALNSELGFMGLIHAAIYAPLLYWAASAVTNALCRLSNAGFRILIFVALLGGLALMASLPIYGAGHGQIHWVNLVDLFAQADKWK